MKVKDAINFYKETASFLEPRKVKKLRRALKKLGNSVKKESEVPTRETELGPASEQKFLNIVNEFKE